MAHPDHTQPHPSLLQAALTRDAAHHGAHQPALQAQPVRDCRAARASRVRSAATEAEQRRRGGQAAAGHHLRRPTHSHFLLALESRPSWLILVQLEQRKAPMAMHAVTTLAPAAQFAAGSLCWLKRSIAVPASTSSAAVSLTVVARPSTSTQQSPRLGALPLRRPRPCRSHQVQG